MQVKYIISSKTELIFEGTNFVPNYGYSVKVTKAELHMCGNSKRKEAQKKSALCQFSKNIRQIKGKFVKTALNYLVCAFKR